MTTVRICRDCGHESDPFEASRYCCGPRSIRIEWRCECGARAEQNADGWSVSGKRRVCTNDALTVRAGDRRGRAK